MAPINSTKPYNFRDITNVRFGRLVAKEYIGRSKHGHSLWLCDCDCGKQTRVATGLLVTGNTASCGCKRADMSRTHGKTSTPEYEAWRSMLQRCCNPKNRRYADYGGRGILVCDRWRHDFPAFLADMGPRPSSGHSLDRIDNNKGYEPSNCQWSTRKKQQRNRKNNRFITHNGITATIAEWGERLGLKRYTVRDRLRKGMSIEKALTPFKPVL